MFQNDLVKNMGANQFSKVTTEDGLSDVLEHIKFNLDSQIPFDAINFVAVDDASNEVFQVNYYTHKKHVCNHCSHDCAFHQNNSNYKPYIFTDYGSLAKQHPDCYFFQRNLKSGYQSSIQIPISHKGTHLGLLVLSSLEENAYTDTHVESILGIEEKIADSINNSLLFEELLSATINGFAKLVESRDDNTGKHLERIRNYAVLLAKKLRKRPNFENHIDENFIKQIYNFSVLHDIGKASIPDHILLKPGRYTPEEYDIMKQHTTIGANIIDNMQGSIRVHRKPFYKYALEIIKYHHEKYDGTGYPENLKGKEIPLSARIVAIADVFDALVSKRPYKEALPVEEVFTIIKEESGKHFDPEIVEVFLENKMAIADINEKYKDPFI